MLLAVEAVLRENVPELTVVIFAPLRGAPLVSKGEAWLCQKLGAKAGDQESDLTMIEEGPRG